jgi:SAM-dependent methyltransferase
MEAPEVGAWQAMGARGADSGDDGAPGRPPSRPLVLDAGDEWRLVDAVRRIARDTIPPQAGVAVVVLAHEELLDLDGRATWRFPPVEDPRERAQLEWTQLVLQLEGLRAQGAEYLIVPASASLWLGRSPSFLEYLERRYDVATAEDGLCVVYALARSSDAQATDAGHRPPDRLPLPPPGLMRDSCGLAEARLFFDSGALAADCIRTALRDSGVQLEDLDAVLDFGCGCGRVMRHWKWLRGPRLLGADTSASAIEWCRAGLPFADFELNAPDPPLAHEAGALDLVYAISVLPHLTESAQLAWMQELARVLRPGGLLLLSVRGASFLDELDPSSRDSFERGELVVLRGIRETIAYHPESYVRERLASGWALEAFAPVGAEDVAEDLVLLRKPSET